MKKFALLLSSLTVASAAFAVNPEVNAQLEKVSKSSMETARMEAGTIKNGKVLSEKKADAVKVFDIKKAPMKVEGLSVSYNEPDGIFSLGLSEDIRSYNNNFRKGPAYTPLTWINTSVGATEFEWEVIKDFNTGEMQTFSTYDFEHSETYSIVDAPILYGMDAAGNTGVYQFGAEAISDTELSDPNLMYFFGGDCDPGGLNVGMTTYMYGQNGGGYTTFGIMSYNTNVKDKEYYNPATGLDYVFTDPSDDEHRGIGLVDPKFKGFANVFGAPASPYLITKMWSWYAFVAKKASNVELTLYKINDEGFITDEVIAAGEAAVEAKKGEQEGMLVFDLYALDEDGLQTDDPIVIDCPFIAVMNFNAEDFEEVTPVGGGGARANVDDPISYPAHALIVVESEGEVGYYRSPYRYYTDETRTELISVTDFMWMVDAEFPWTYVIDGVNEAKAPNEGGEVSFNISSYYGIQYFGYSLPEDCDWIDFETASVTNNEELKCQVLNLPVAALPEGVEGRSAVIEVEGIGTNLTLTVTQGEGAAVNVVVAEKNAQYFDLQGRRVANPEKGIFIKKVGNKAEKVIL
ncbi:MAG: hypothetical protein K2L11_00220 [Muribaculaceae bacterium]|nr:hypothetical protein [Muribaculaceae bacterium]